MHQDLLANQLRDRARAKNLHMKDLWDGLSVNAYAYAFRKDDTGYKGKQTGGRDPQYT